MYNAKSEFFDEFWLEFQNLWLALYGTRLATVASIAGEAYAGGCIIALACDARIIAASAKIGLNEAAFGLVAPPWTAQMMVDTVGRRQGEKALSLGTIFTATEALRIGLVDRIVICGDESVEKKIGQVNKEAELEALVYTKAPGRSSTKALVRKANIAKLSSQDDRLHDTKLFKECVLHPDVQGMLGKYLESLSSGTSSSSSRSSSSSSSNNKKNK